MSVYIIMECIVNMKTYRNWTQQHFVRYMNGFNDTFVVNIFGLNVPCVFSNTISQTRFTVNALD